MSVHLKKFQLDKGFTLIEMLVYLVLFTIIIGGGMVGAYQIIESTDRIATKTVLEQDGNFILRKIDWAIGQSVVTPSTPSSTHLDLGLIEFELIGSNIEISKDNGVTTTPLNSPGIIVASTSFVFIPSGGGKPAEVKATIILDSPYTNEQVFQTTKYLRK